MVDQKQTLDRVAVESDENLHRDLRLGHAEAYLLEAYPLEDGLQEGLVETEVAE